MRGVDTDGNLVSRSSDAVLEAMEPDATLPAYRPGDVDMDPAAYRELRG